MPRLHPTDPPTSAEEAEQYPTQHFRLAEAAKILHRHRQQLQRYAQAGVIAVDRDENGWRTQTISGAQLAALFRHPKRPPYVRTMQTLAEARRRQQAKT